MQMKCIEARLEDVWLRCVVHHLIDNARGSLMGYRAAHSVLHCGVVLVIWGTSGRYTPTPPPMSSAVGQWISPRLKEHLLFSNSTPLSTRHAPPTHHMTRKIIYTNTNVQQDGFITMSPLSNAALFVLLGRKRELNRGNLISLLPVELTRADPPHPLKIIGEEGEGRM